MTMPHIMILAQAAPEAEQVAQAIEVVDFGKIVTAVFIIGAAVIVNRVLVEVIERLGEGQARRRLMMKKVSSFVRLGIFVFAAYLVAATFLEGQREAMLGVGGTIAVAAGFALKDTLSSIMAGILILFDQPFQVGDRVQFGNVYGEVKEIGLRAVRIVTLDDNEFSIPNNKFLTEAVASANAGALDMMVVMPFYVAVTEDFELARQIVFEACITSKYVFLAKPVTIVVKEEGMEGFFVTSIYCKSYVIDVRYEEAFITDVTTRVKRAFRQSDIYGPYRRQTPEWDRYRLPRSSREAQISESRTV